MAATKGLPMIGVASGVLGVILVGVTAYAAAAVTGRAAMTWPLFFGMLGILTVANAWLLALVWRRREVLGPLTHVAYILWGGVSIWYWTFAPAYYALNMNLNAHQLAWTALAFFWEVPIIGGLVLVTLGLLMFRPIVQPQNGVLLPVSPQKTYMRVLRFPRRIAILLFALSVLGYILGAVQLGLFAAVSGFELIKSVLNGPVVSIFLAVFYYLTLDAYLDRTRRQVSSSFSQEIPQTRSLRRRLAGVILATLIGGVGLLALLMVNWFQATAEQRLATELQNDLAVFRELDSNEIALDLQQSGRGGHGYLQILSPQDIEGLPISSETRTAIQNQDEGVVRDLYKQGKMIAFLKLPDGRYLVSIAYLSSFYIFWRLPEVINYVFGSVLLVALTMGIFMFVVYEITRALISLRLFAKEPELSAWNKLEGMHTGDEIESVGRAFSRYVEKAKEVDEVKREFISVASHQLRTPLTAIKWYTEILLSKRDGELTAVQEENLNRIARSSHRMVHLVNDLLNVSRVDSGRLAIKPQETNLAEFVQLLIDEVIPQSEQVKCEFKVEGIRQDKVSIDQMLLRQVVHNLFINAIKYRSQERTCQVVVELRKDETGRFVLSIADNGVGIPKKQQHRVFEKFFRGDNIVTIDTEGTGLGLYVSKMLLEMAGCAIAFESKEGRGTTFRITIPEHGMLAKPGEIGIADSELTLDRK